MKHMKKSMFITTIFMVVLLIVAVSTATFAWYTSSNTVNTVATEVNSATSEGANISIGWDDNTPVGVSSLSFWDNDTDYNPLVPLKTGETFAFTNDTDFYTAHISYGNLTGHAVGDEYIGKRSEGGSSVFYVINYARVATNVTFSANVTGENGARLRVAVFNATTGALVFTNRPFYTGEIIPTVAKSYTLVESEPADWADNFRAYSTSNSEDVFVEEVAPTFVPNNVWKKNGEVFEVLTVQPGDWEGKYNTYSSNPNMQVDILGVAPEFEGSIYRINAEVPEHMVTSASTVSPTSNQVLIAKSNDGATGTSQGFIVKAWFDGPTQVDAYGGLSARFALTVQASNVTP